MNLISNASMKDLLDSQWPGYPKEYLKTINQIYDVIDLERDVLIDMWIGNMDSPADIDIIESDKLREKFGKIQNSEDFLGYINDFLQ